MGTTKKPDGWYVEFRVSEKNGVLGLDNYGKIKRWKTGTTNKTMAKQQEAIIKTELMKGKMKSERARSVSFSEWADTYLSLEGVRRLATYQDRVNAIRLQMVPFFGKKPLNDITQEDVEKYRSQRLRRDGKKPAMGTLNNDHTILKAMFSVAVQKGMVDVNVAKKVPLPNPNNERDRILTQEEWSRLYENAASHIQPILLVAYHLGLRLGEILNLTWNRVDLKRGFIHLRTQDTKTNEDRLVPMTPAISECLLELSKVRSLTTNRVILFEGRPVKSIKTAFHTAAEKAGIEDFRFHDLRHCAATNLRRAGIDTVTAMKIVGHKSEQMHRRYNTVAEHDLTHAAAKLHTYISNTLITPADFRPSVPAAESS